MAVIRSPLLWMILSIVGVTLSDGSGRVKAVTLNDGFSQLAHDVSSGPVTFIDTRHVLIRKLVYDGKGPDAYFLVGNGKPKGDDQKVPDEMGRVAKLNPYSGKDVLLMLPEGLQWTDFDYLAIYCIKFKHLFGQVDIPKRIRLPRFPQIKY